MPPADDDLRAMVAAFQRMRQVLTETAYNSDNPLGALALHCAMDERVVGMLNSHVRPTLSRWLSYVGTAALISRIDALERMSTTRANLAPQRNQTQSVEKGAHMATFVLVHGAWHGGWCWQKLIPYLEAAGHTVYAPTLTGLAERASERSPDVGLDTHIQDIVGLLVDEDLHGVILVGHSYGGMVITGVVDQAPERIGRLVYLDTFVPRDGDSMTSVSPVVIWLLRRQTLGDGWSIASRGDYGVTTEPDRSWVLRSVAPQPLKTLEQPLHLKNPAIVSTKPRTHIDCTSSGVVFSLLRHLLAPRALPPTDAGWRLRQLPTGHDAMITAPRELADLLLEGV